MIAAVELSQADIPLGTRIIATFNIADHILTNNTADTQQLE